MDEFLAELGSQPLISTLLHFNRMGKTSTIFLIPGPVTGIEKKNISKSTHFPIQHLLQAVKGDG
jgi:hypothetical protein